MTIRKATPDDISGIKQLIAANPQTILIPSCFYENHLEVKAYKFTLAWFC